MRMYDFMLVLGVLCHIDQLLMIMAHA